MPAGYFVVTSNVDGHFEEAGFPSERILEQHGSIHRLQCCRPCCERIWLEEPKELDIDLENITARGRLPRCPACGDVARPNVLMFVDADWLANVRREQAQRYRQWLASVRGRRLVILECGAGKAIATIRNLGEGLASEQDRVTLVRVNPDAADASEPVIPVRLGALEALTRIEERLPEGFREAARAGATVREGPVTEVAALHRAKVALRGPERLPPAVKTREMEIIDFVGTLDERLAKPAWSREVPKYSDLRKTTFLDLDTGLVEPFNYLGIRVEDEQACLDCWRGPAPDRYAPLPEIAGHHASGYLMTGRAVKLDDAETDIRRGAVIILLCSSERDVILTVGAARWPLDGATLWRWMYESGSVTLKALEFPRVPWAARMLDAAAAEHAAMLPALKEIGRVMAWTWLRVHMYHDQMKGKDSEGE